MHSGTAASGGAAAGCTPSNSRGGGGGGSGDGTHDPFSAHLLAQVRGCTSAGQLRRLLLRYRGNMGPTHIAHMLQGLTQALTRPAARRPQRSGQLNAAGVSSDTAAFWRASSGDDGGGGGGGGASSGASGTSHLYLRPWARTGGGDSQQAPPGAPASEAVAVSGTWQQVVVADVAYSELDAPPHEQQLRAIMLADLCNLMWQHLDGFSADELCMVLSSWGGLGWAPEPQLLADTAAALTSPRVLCVVSPSALVAGLLGLARLGQVDGRVLGVCAPHVLRMLPHLRLGEVADAAAAAAAAGGAAAPLLEPLVRHAAQLVAAGGGVGGAAAPSAEQALQPEQVATVLWSLAKAVGGDSYPQPAVDVLCDWCAAHAGGMAPRTLTTLLWSLEWLRHWHGPLLDAAACALQPRLALCSSHELVTIAKALAALGWREPDAPDAGGGGGGDAAAGSGLVAALAGAVAARAGQTSVEDLAAAAWALVGVFAVQAGRGGSGGGVGVVLVSALHDQLALRWGLPGSLGWLSAGAHGSVRIADRGSGGDADGSGSSGGSSGSTLSRQGAAMLYLAHLRLLVERFGSLAGADSMLRNPQLSALLPGAAALHACQVAWEEGARSRGARPLSAAEGHVASLLHQLGVQALPRQATRDELLPVDLLLPDYRGEAVALFVDGPDMLLRNAPERQCGPAALRAALLGARGYVPLTVAAPDDDAVAGLTPVALADLLDTAVAAMCVPPGAPSSDAAQPGARED